MRCRAMGLGVALACGVALLSSVSNVGAQETPPVVTSPDTPTDPNAPVQITQPRPVEGTGAITETAPPASSTTKTTSAEYVDNVGHEEERRYRPNRPLLVTGAAMFGATYVTSVVGAAASDLDADKRLYIPVVGPWLDLGQRPCTFGTGPACTTGDNVTSAFLIAGGALQGAGVILALTSLAVPEKKTVRTEAKPEVHVLPLSVAGGAGAGAIGTF